MKKINKIFLLTFIFCILINSKSFSSSKIADDKSSISMEIQENLKIKDVNDDNNANIIIVQALNKITAKSYIYEIRIGDTINFERLILEPLFCWKSLPDEILENKVLIKITEYQINKKKNQIFYGWMFSSSPSISTMEHPMYDITIIDCKKK